MQVVTAAIAALLLLLTAVSAQSPLNTDTDGGAGSVSGVVAAFDFRKGLKNLVNPDTFTVTDEFGVPRTQEDGACFTNDQRSPSDSKPHYRIGHPVQYNESLLILPEWTLFARFRQSAEHVTWVGMDGDFQGTGWYAALYGVQQIARNASGFPTGTQSSFTHMDANLDSHIHYQKVTFYHQQFTLMEPICTEHWCNVAVAMNSHSATFHFNERSFKAHEKRAVGVRTYKSLEMFVGQRTPWYADRVCMRCFGIAYKQLSSDELQKVFAAFCP